MDSSQTFLAVAYLLPGTHGISLLNLPALVNNKLAECSISGLPTQEHNVFTQRRWFDLELLMDESESAKPVREHFVSITSLPPYLLTLAVLHNL